MNKFGWLAVTLAGCAISLYGNKKVQESVKKEQADKLDRLYIKMNS